MSLALLYTRALDGITAPSVKVEVHLGNGLPSFTIVGLPEAEVRESRERVRAALQNTQFDFPARRITVNLAPADLPKESARFDLPIALGILAASGQIPSDKLKNHEFAGELALDGNIRPIRGALTMAGYAEKTDRTFIFPEASAMEAARLPSANIRCVNHLLEVCAYLRGETELPIPSPTPFSDHHLYYPDMEDVKGQLPARRAIEIAAAGGHHLLMVGPPGTGKSMLANRIPGILPAMTEEEALSAAMVQSVSRRGFDPDTFGQRPFRNPHHTISPIALTGGGAHPKPGEISLAHHGILFLDELTEFDRKTLEVLREPLETEKVTISRATRQVVYPAAFQLVAAMNPCPCGYLGHPSGKCHCTEEAVARYRRKISGPLLDRIDLLVEVGALDQDALITQEKPENSEQIRQRVYEARKRQMDRQNHTNAALSIAGIETFCKIDEAGEKLIRQAIDRLNLSARAYHRILKVARTIADIEGESCILSKHIAETIQYRRQFG